MKFKNKYLSIYSGVRMPWFLLTVFLVLAMINSHVGVKAITMTASIIDATQNVIKTEMLIEYIVFLVLSSALSLSQSFISGVAFQKINLGVRSKLWKKIMHLPMDASDRDNGNGLITRITTDADSACEYVNVIISIFTTVYGFFVVVEKLLSYNQKMTIAMLGILPISVIFTILYGKISFKAGNYSKLTLSNMMAYLAERVRNFRLIKSSCTEQEEFDRGKEQTRKVFKSDLLNTLAKVVDYVSNDFISLATLIISFVYGGILVSRGELTVGKVIGFYTLTSLLVSNVTILVGYIANMSGVVGTLHRIALILESEEESQEGAEMDVLDENLHFQNVSYGYDPEKPVLHNVSCTIPKGKITAIVGPNGAGKSTMFKLLERMYTPTEGQILFGNTGSESFRLDSWRKVFGIVSQDDMVLSGTIKENICYGVERNVAEEELIAVAKKANAYDFIMATPGGFSAQIGDDGGNLSGGQRQCLAIARAMMRNPDYLLLDECTSNLDMKSEQIVSEALTNLMQGRTTIMIAHSYSATALADHIIVMNDGRVEAEGSPEELMESNAYYRAFAKRGS